ncbi:MAG: hypothetical protein ACOCNB_05930 [Acetivibrio ethanolgignens]
MSEKKVIAFIVEGPSDEAALGTIMKGYFSSNEVQFIVVHGDITLKDYVSTESILIKINEQLENIRKKYRYRLDDFIKIIHIVDTDGAYISKSDIKEAEVEEIQYYEDHIEARNVEETVRRNEKKGEILFKLRKTGKVNGIPYKIYFNSCNLEHVLYGELKNFSDEEKEILSDEFAEKYEGKAREFINFISDSSIAVLGSYQKTWDYIEKDKNSLCRNSNMHLLFEGR